MKCNLPDRNYFLGKSLPGYPGYTIEEYRNSGSNAHVFRAHSNELKADLAVKLIPRGNLRTPPESPDAWKREVQKANVLESPVVVHCFHVFDWKDEAGGIDCVALCFEYVPGISLRQYISNHKRDISVRFIEDLLKTLLDLLHEMTLRGIIHGDLHSGNILVKEPTAFQLDKRAAFKVTDFGVGTVTGELKFKDDFEQLAAVLKELLKNVNLQTVLPRDNYAFDLLNDHFLARHLVETDRNRDPLARNPEELFKILIDIDHEFLKLGKESQKRLLQTPFEFLSCEQLGNSDTLLNALYSDLFLGLQAIQETNNLVLTGPRG